MGSDKPKQMVDQLKNAIVQIKVQLQACREERGRINKDIERWSDRVMAMAAEYGVGLRALDAERKRKIALSRQLEAAETALSSSGPVEDDLQALERKMAALQEEKGQLTQRCAETRQSLSHTRSLHRAVEAELQRHRGLVATAAASQSQKSWEKQLLDAYVAKLDVPARDGDTVGPPPRRRRRRRQ